MKERYMISAWYRFANRLADERYATLRLRPAAMPTKPRAYLGQAAPRAIRNLGRYTRA